MSMVYEPRRGKPDVLGIDFGGVIIDASRDLFNNEPEVWTAASVPPLEGAFETLRYLARIRFGDRIWIISHAGNAVKQARTILWLIYHNAYEEMSIPPHHVVFCPTSRAKARFCDELGVTHFLDNSVPVLRGLSAEVIKYLFLPILPGPQDLKTQTRFLPDGINPIASWEEFGQTIQPSL